LEKNPSDVRVLIDKLIEKAMNEFVDLRIKHTEEELEASLG
jgi:hypothetical protein